MSANSIVSVVSTFFNTPVPFLREAVESVLAQTYVDWELWLVDDGSSNGSTTLARQFADNYRGRIHYLEHEGHANRGMSASRQLGIAKAAGDYVAFLDSDDVWLPHKLDDQVALFNRCPEAGMVYGNTLYWSSWLEPAGQGSADFIPRLGVKSDMLVPPPNLLPLLLRGEAAVPCTCSVLVRRRCLELIGGFEESFRDLYEDQVFYAKMFLEVPVYVSAKCWDKYRQHSVSSSGTASVARQRAARLVYLRWLERYLRARNAAAGPVWDAVQTELWMVRVPATIRRVLKPLRRLRNFAKVA